MADRLAQAMRDAEPAFRGDCFAPADGVAEAMRRVADRPVILVDTQDNPGAGGNSDTTGMLRALVQADAQDAAIGLITDPAAAAAAHSAGVGATIDLSLGGRSGIPGDAPFQGLFTVDALSDGSCHATGPYYGARIWRLGLRPACASAACGSRWRPKRRRWPTGRCSGSWASCPRIRPSWSSKARTISALISPPSPWRS